MSCQYSLFFKLLLKNHMLLSPWWTGLQAVGVQKWQNFSAVLWQLPSASGTLDDMEISCQTFDTPLVKWITEETIGLPHSATLTGPS